MILVVARLLDPSSELHIAEQWYDKTALPELLGVPADRVDDNRLYRGLDALLPHKEALEVYLKNRLGELFKLEYDLLLYDVTSTFFEGQAKTNPLAQQFEQEILKANWHQIRDGLEVKLCHPPLSEESEELDASQQETFILCRSRDRAEKDAAIVRRSEAKIEERLKSMNARCEKQSRDPMKVEREIGRLLGQNTRAARLFDVKVCQTDSGAARVDWKKIQPVQDWHALADGCYLLRTNVRDWTDEELWKAYIQLTEAEAAFRIHKTDLSLRPVWHHKEDRVLAHILVCFLAYVLWKTLGQICQAAGLGDDPRRVLAELSDIRLVDVVLPTRSGTEIRRRCVTRPSDHQQILLEKLKLRLPSRIIQNQM
jgi:hypothetical protein